MKPTPARITFTDLNEVEQQIRFHSVVIEEHKAKSVATKFPVATGFEVTRHTIKKNREVVVHALVSNVLLEGGNNVDVKTANTCASLHKSCASLVDNGIVCKVVTNLGVYDPVVFTSYETKTEEGFVDTILIILKGEQMQVKGSLNKTSPEALSFRILPDDEKETRLAELEQLGFFPDPGCVMSEATADLGTDFTVETLTGYGDPTTTTYLCNGQDPTTGKYEYGIHTDLEEVYGSSTENVFNMFSLGNAAATTTACLVEGTVGFVEDEVADMIDTELGNLERSAYGAYYETLNMAGGGEALAAIGIDCIVAGGLSGATGATPNDFDTSLPTVEEMTQGAVNTGNDAVNATVQVLSPTTFFKISDNGSQDILGNVI